jgi:hypothetical protein
LAYTAPDSRECRQKVIAGPDRTFTTDRLFSLRQQWLDQWPPRKHRRGARPGAAHARGAAAARRDFPAHVEQVALLWARKEVALCKAQKSKNA